MYYKCKVCGSTQISALRYVEPYYPEEEGHAILKCHNNHEFSNNWVGYQVQEEVLGPDPIDIDAWQNSQDP